MVLYDVLFCPTIEYDMHFDTYFYALYFFMLDTLGCVKRLKILSFVIFMLNCDWYDCRKLNKIDQY